MKTYVTVATGEQNEYFYEKTLYAGNSFSEASRIGLKHNEQYTNDVYIDVWEDGKHTNRVKREYTFASPE